MDHACLDCGQKLVKKPGPGRWPKRCQPCCKRQVKLAAVDCVMCGKTFTPKSVVNVCCSRQCYLARNLALANRRYREDPEYRIRQLTRSRVQCGVSLDLPYEPIPRPCATCGEEYTPKTPHPQNRYCSRACRDRSPAALQRFRAKARQRRTVEREPYCDEEIFERDGWKCGLCGKRIGRSYIWPHPRSASIDHVVPITKGGVDVRANVQAAHLECNVSKGNRGGGEQLALVG